MKDVLLALAALFLITAPAFADDATDQRNKEWNVDVEELKKLSKEKNCKDVVMYREVLPFFGKETTKEASREITIQNEKEDLASGRAEILFTKYDCQELIGSFFVMCTTDTALCYFEEPKNITKGSKKLSDEIKKKEAKKNKKK